MCLPQLFLPDSVFAQWKHAPKINNFCAINEIQLFKIQVQTGVIPTHVYKQSEYKFHSERCIQALYYRVWHVWTKVICRSVLNAARHVFLMHLKTEYNVITFGLHQTILGKGILNFIYQQTFNLKVTQYFKILK